MDLSKYDLAVQADKGRFLHLESPEGDLLLDKGEPVGLTVIGSDSKEFQRYRHKAIDHRMERTRVGLRGKIKGLSSEDSEEEDTELLARAIKNFHHITVDGQGWSYTHEKALALLERFRWIREQVDAFINDRSAFLGES